jgi:hypothetical protein
MVKIDQNPVENRPPQGLWELTRKGPGYLPKMKLYLGACTSMFDLLQITEYVIKISVQYYDVVTYV